MPLDPVEWRKQPYYKRIDTLIKLYLENCTPEGAFINKKISPKYFQLRKFFYEKEPDEILYVYDYLYGMAGKEIMNLSAVFIDAEKYRKAMIRNDNKKKIKCVTQRVVTLEDVLAM